MPFALYRRGIGWCPCDFVQAGLARVLADPSDPKVTQLYGAIAAHEHVLRLDIAVDDVRIMGVL